MIGAVPYASIYVYSPQGQGIVSERSRLMLALLKADNVKFIPKYAARVRQQAESSTLQEFFSNAECLMPVPRSAPQPMGVLSVTEHLAGALVREGIGQRVLPILKRKWAVPKSATAPVGKRPTVKRHYESLVVELCGVEACAQLPERIMLVDDVITKGRTLLAAATRVREVFPGVAISAFALVRTMGLITGVDCLLEPALGEIRWAEGDALRSP